MPHSLRSLALAIALAGILLACWPGVAGAHAESHFDLNDSRSALDLEKITLDPHGTRMSGTITTYDRWRNSILRSRDNYLGINFDTVGDNDPDFLLIVKTGLYGPVATVRRWTSFRRRESVVIGSGSAHRISTTGVAFSFPTFLIAPQGGFIRWEAVSSFRGRSYCRNVCYDTRGSYPHDV